MEETPVFRARPPPVALEETPAFALEGQETKMRSEKKRAKRRARKAAAQLWHASQPAVAMDSEPQAQRQLYRGASAYCWVNSAGLCLQAPAPMAAALLQHFGKGPQCPHLTVLEVTFLPSTPTGLSRHARRVLEEPNAGGSSEASEAWAYEALKLLLNVTLVATEMEINYLHDIFPRLCGAQGRTDFAVQLPCTGEVVGVSVTRAFAYKRVFEEADAKYVLNKKLDRILSSTTGCTGRWRWSRQILFIWARSYSDAVILRQVFDDMSSDKKADTLVVVAVCPAAHLFGRSAAALCDAARAECGLVIGS
mmetsp:Transcript_845/g.1632  ORF Transcript_845/g.1632 Transcript_845/m.1632 type:complete len:308 (-) Transcript_845:34-957(-)